MPQRSLRGVVVARLVAMRRRYGIPNAVDALGFLAFLTHIAFAGSGAQEYCQSQTFKASCWATEVIVMESALYGRMRLGKCVEADLGYIGCHADVLHLADKECSGKRTCEINVPNPDLDKTAPCFKELKTYFEAEYKCVKVATAQTGLCGASNFVKLVTTEGDLSSYIAMETGCGSATTPWIIQVDAGQRINLTLYDFSEKSPGHVQMNTCAKYAVIRERALNRSTVICAGSVRVTHVYLSLSNSIEVSLMKPQNKGHFILHYETLGCPDLDPPDNAWFVRTELGADIGCKTTSTIWQLTCENNQWVGNVGNCTESTLKSKTDRSHKKTMDLNYGLSVVIIIGIALILGLSILCIGLVCFARRKRPRRRAVKSIAKPGTSNAYKLYEKAPCIRMDPMMAQSCIHHHHPININGNEYSHIWETMETPIPEAEFLGCLNESAYGTKSCECSYTPARELYIGDTPGATQAECSANKIYDKCPHGGATAPVPPVVPPAAIEGYRYFVLDRGVDSRTTSTLERDKLQQQQQQQLQHQQHQQQQQHPVHDPDIIPEDTMC